MKPVIAAPAVIAASAAAQGAPDRRARRYPAVQRPELRFWALLPTVRGRPGRPSVAADRQSGIAGKSRAEMVCRHRPRQWPVPETPLSGCADARRLPAAYPPMRSSPRRSPIAAARLRPAQSNPIAMPPAGRVQPGDSQDRSDRDYPGRSPQSARQRAARRKSSPCAAASARRQAKRPACSRQTGAIGQLPAGSGQYAGSASFVSHPVAGRARVHDSKPARLLTVPVGR